MKRKPVIHRITIAATGPAWCSSYVYPEQDQAATEWPKVTCKRCIRVGGDTARDEIGADRAERRAQRRIT